MSKVLSLLHTLSGHHQLLLHLYAGWHAADGTDPPWLPGFDREVRSYARNGFSIEVVLRYESKQGDWKGYARFVAAMVSHFSSTRAVRYIQVTNEANAPLDPAASDGAYPGATSALVAGVEAAHHEALSLEGKTHRHILIGFNVAWAPTPILSNWFSGLWGDGGRELSSSVNWVGLDLYPGTYLPGLPSSTPSGIARSAPAVVREELVAMRNAVLPAAHLGRTVALQLTEIGYATSLADHHSDADQASAVKAFARGACSVASKVGLTTFEWFELTDAPAPAADLSPTALHLPWRFGLLDNDLVPKPAFSEYEHVIARGCPA